MINGNLESEPKSLNEKEKEVNESLHLKRQNTEEIIENNQNENNYYSNFNKDSLEGEEAELNRSKREPERSETQNIPLITELIENNKIQEENSANADNISDLSEMIDNEIAHKKHCLQSSNANDQINDKTQNPVLSPLSKEYEIPLPDCYNSPIASFKVNSEIVQIANEFVENYENKHLKEKLEPNRNLNKEVNMNCLMSPDTYESYNNIQCSCSSCMQSPNAYNLNANLNKDINKLEVKANQNSNFISPKPIDVNLNLQNIKTNLNLANIDNGKEMSKNNTNLNNKNHVSTKAKNNLNSNKDNDSSNKKLNDSFLDNYILKFKNEMKLPVEKNIKGSNNFTINNQIKNNNNFNPNHIADYQDRNYRQNNINANYRGASNFYQDQYGNKIPINRSVYDSSMDLEEELEDNDDDDQGEISPIKKIEFYFPERKDQIKRKDYLYKKHQSDGIDEDDFQFENKFMIKERNGYSTFKWPKKDDIATPDNGRNKFAMPIPKKPLAPNPSARANLNDNFLSPINYNNINYNYNDLYKNNTNNFNNTFNNHNFNRDKQHIYNYGYEDEMRFRNSKNGYITNYENYDINPLNKNFVLNPNKIYRKNSNYLDFTDPNLYRNVSPYDNKSPKDSCYPEDDAQSLISLRNNIKSKNIRIIPNDLNTNNFQRLSDTDNFNDINRHKEPKIINLKFESDFIIDEKSNCFDNLMQLLEKVPYKLENTVVNEINIDDDVPPSFKYDLLIDYDRYLRILKKLKITELLKYTVSPGADSITNDDLLKIYKGFKSFIDNYICASGKRNIPHNQSLNGLFNLENEFYFNTHENQNYRNLINIYDFDLEKKLICKAFSLTNDIIAIAVFLRNCLSFNLNVFRFYKVINYQGRVFLANFSNNKAQYQKPNLKDIKEKKEFDAKSLQSPRSQNSYKNLSGAFKNISYKIVNSDVNSMHNKNPNQTNQLNLDKYFMKNPNNKYGNNNLLKQSDKFLNTNKDVFSNINKSNNKILFDKYQENDPYTNLNFENEIYIDLSEPNKLQFAYKNLVETINCLIPNYELSSETLACLKATQDFEGLFAGYYTESYPNPIKFNHSIFTTPKGNEPNDNNKEIEISKIKSPKSPDIISSKSSVFAKDKINDNTMQNEIKLDAAFISQEKQYNEKAKNEFNQFLNESLINNPFEADDKTRNPIYDNRLKSAALAKIQQSNKPEINSPNATSHFKIHNNNESQLNSLKNPIEKSIINKFNNSIQNFIHEPNQIEDSSPFEPKDFANEENAVLNQKDTKSSSSANNLNAVNQYNTSANVEKNDLIITDNNNNNNKIASNNINRNNTQMNTDKNFNYDPEFIKNEKLQSNKTKEAGANSNSNLRDPNDKFCPPKSLENLKNKINLKVKIPGNSKKEASEQKKENVSQLNEGSKISQNNLGDLNSKPKDDKINHANLAVNLPNSNLQSKTIKKNLKINIPSKETTKEEANENNDKLKESSKEADFKNLNAPKKEEINLELNERNEKEALKPKEANLTAFNKDNREKLIERLLNRKTNRSENEKSNLVLNTETISTVLFDQSQKSTSEYIDFIANLNRIDLNNQMEKKIQDLIERNKQSTTNINTTNLENNNPDVNNKTDLLNNIEEFEKDKKAIKKPKTLEATLKSAEDKNIKEPKTNKEKTPDKLAPKNSKEKNNKKAKESNSANNENESKEKLTSSNNIRKIEKNNNKANPGDKGKNVNEAKNKEKKIVQITKVTKDSKDPKNKLTTELNNENMQIDENLVVPDLNLKDNKTPNKQGNTEEFSKMDEISEPKLTNDFNKFPEETNNNFNHQKNAETNNNNNLYPNKADLGNNLPALLNKNSSGDVYTNPNSVKYLNPLPLNFLTLSPNDHNFNIPSPYINLGLQPLNAVSINNSPWQSELLLALNGISSNTNNNVHNFASNENLSNSALEKNKNLSTQKGFVDEFFLNSKIVSPLTERKSFKLDAESDLKNFNLSQSQGIKENNSNSINQQADLVGNEVDQIDNKTNDNQEEEEKEFEIEIEKEEEEVELSSNSKEDKNIVKTYTIKEAENEDLANTSMNLDEKENENLFMKKLKKLKTEEKLATLNLQNKLSFNPNSKDLLGNLSQINKFISPALNYSSNLFDPKSANNLNTFNSVNMHFYPGFVNNSPFPFSGVYSQMSNNIMNYDQSFIANVDSHIIQSMGTFSNINNNFVGGVGQENVTNENNFYDSIKDAEGNANSNFDNDAIKK